jgi:alanine-glyoxylate transaminase/serine-glyoxylate transaminase/serine-pyruvate transaminase
MVYAPTRRSPSCWKRLENRWKRHERNGRALHAGLEAMGLVLHADEGTASRPTTVRIPDGVSDPEVRGALERYSIEIGGSGDCEARSGRRFRWASPPPPGMSSFLSAL